MYWFLLLEFFTCINIAVTFLGSKLSVRFPR
jgi:hypothetical protein